MILILGLMLILLGAIAFVDSNRKNIVQQGQVKNISVELEAVVRPERIYFTVYPEKRIPVTNNWDSFVTLLIHDCSDNSVVASFNNVPIDSLGQGSVDIPITEILLDKTYSFSVKAFSHLNKKMNCYGVNNVYSTVNFTGEGFLKAGDTSVVSDNYINSLDLSNTIRFLYTTDYKNDLNQDGEVNSLDLSIQLFNYYEAGD